MSRIVIMAGLLLTAATGFLGCGQDDCITEPVLYGGLIEGYVGDGGPHDQQVDVVYRSFYRTNPGFNVSVRVDSTGYYQMPVPPGKGYLTLLVEDSPQVFYSANGATANDELSDTLDVAMGAIRRDFVLGRASVEVNLPPEQDFAHHEFKIRGTDAWDSDYRYLHVRNGVAVLNYRMLAAETYDIKMSLVGERYQLPLSNLAGNNERVLLDIKAGLEHQVSVTVPSPTVLSGTISGSWQAMGEDLPHIAVVCGDEDEVIIDFDTDLDGTFTFNDYRMQPLNVHVGCGRIGRWIGGDDRESATVFDMGAGQDLSFEYVENGFHYDLEYPGDISEIYASAKLFDEWGNILYETGRWYRSRECLSRSFSNLDPGTYYLWLEPYFDSGRWLPRFHDAATSLPDATPIVVGDGGSVTYINIPLIDGGIISGVLTDETGTPFPAESLEFYLYTHDEEFSTVWNIDTRHYDETSGFYEVYRLEDGDYNIGVSVNDGPIGWYPEGQLVMDTTLITITDHVVIEDADWQIPSTP